MTTEEQIEAYINSQEAQKANDLQTLHCMITNLSPKPRQWFFDGKNSEDKTVSNPTIGYGFQTMTYAKGKTRDFFRIGVSANKTGISVYILGFKDKTHLSKTYGEKLGKASVTGYCIKFKNLQSIDPTVLEAAIKEGLSLGL